MQNQVGLALSQNDRILIAPVQGGWLLRATFIGEPLAFLSGADAERHAHVLAARLAGVGRGVGILIYDRAGAVAATAFYPAVGVEHLATGG